MIIDPVISVYITNRNYGKYLENAIRNFEHAIGDTLK